MRSQALFCRSRSVLKPWSFPRGSIYCSVLAIGSRKALRSAPALQNRHSSNLSSTPSPQPEITPPRPPLEEHEDPEPKPKVRGRTKRAQERLENAALPQNLNIFWPPDGAHTPIPSALPPPELLQEALNNLLITLHPQTQHRATYASPNGSPIEPTLALYCPIEGGDYVIDETVRELAHRTGAEVLVLDTIEIAAGEWGAFGKAATAIQFPENPLHFASSHTGSSHPLPPSSISIEQDVDDPEESSGPHIILSASQPFPFSQVGVPVSRPSRSGIVLSRRSPPSKAKAFFDDIVNMPSPNTGDSVKDTASPLLIPPRIIYIRDYPTLAPSLSSWYSSLVASVRGRRQGPISRPTSPVSNPTTIVFGITPSIVPTAPSPSMSNSSGVPSELLRFLLNRQASGISRRRNGHLKAPESWDESDNAQKARERRLRERLRNWESGVPTFYEELPEPPSLSDRGGDSAASGAGVIIAGPGGQPFAPGFISPPQIEPSKSDGNNSYFRLSVIVPNTRVTTLESECRVARRRHINQLVVRMAVGSVGGILSERSEVPSQSSKVEVPSVQEVIEQIQPPEEIASEPPNTADSAVSVVTKAYTSTVDKGIPGMWDEWGQRVEIWSTMKEIADHAVGNIVASLATNDTDGIAGSDLSLDPTPIPWSAVETAWCSQRTSRHTRRVWIEESSGRTSDDEDRAKTTEKMKEVQIDEVIERVKNDPDLDQHESRLLGCIVDSSSMSTTFDQVHLPPHTIDSVRTLVSLPLLHPQAFAHGILKQHTMTGALLFGPPGTGKTLVVRALAKESGARMLIIKPSDVMDMYVGEGEKLVRSVFSLARRLSPCVIFLDELDALFGARVSARETGGATAHRGVITEFMQEMDGLKTSRDSNVIVIGATNRPFDLDDAVLRRLPRRLLIDLPGQRERQEILKILLRDETLAPEVDLEHLAMRTESFSGSDLKHLCVSAALDAVKERVTLPWNVPHSLVTENKVTPDPEAAPLPSGTDATQTSPRSLPNSAPRILSLSNFTKALGEITPSASESLGTLSDLRKWNDEFGEGGKQRKRMMWGGRFGFSDRTSDGEGRVSSSPPG